MINILIWAASIALTACSGHITDKSDTKTNVTGSSSETINNTNSTAADSSIIGKAELTKIYSKAIAGYMEAIYKKDKTVFDTLFFSKRKNGQPDDFPDIEMPETINGTRLLLLTPEETNENKRLYRKSSPFINLIGWVDKEKAEFIFVTFYPEFQHQYDCYINYKYNAIKDGDIRATWR